jgi:hypothetical protein
MLSCLGLVGYWPLLPHGTLDSAKACLKCDNPTINNQTKLLQFQSHSMLQVNHDITRRLPHKKETNEGLSSTIQSINQLQVKKTHKEMIEHKQQEFHHPCSSLPTIQIDQLVPLSLAGMEVLRMHGTDLGLLPMIVFILFVVACFAWAILGQNSSSTTDEAPERMSQKETEYWQACERIVPSSRALYPQSNASSSQLRSLTHHQGRAMMPNPSVSGSLSMAKALKNQEKALRSPAPSLQSANPYSEYFSSTEVTSSHDLYSAAHVPSSSASTQPLLPSGHVAPAVHDVALREEVLDQTKVIVRTTVVTGKGTEMSESELDAVLSQRQRLVEASGSQRQMYESPRGKKSTAQDTGRGELESLLDRRQKTVEATNSQRELYLSPRTGKSASAFGAKGELEAVFAKRRTDG